MPISNRNENSEEVLSLIDSYAARLSNINYQGHIPQQFLCPISHEIMDQPAIINDKHNYELSSLVQYFQHNPHAKCPQDPSSDITVIIPNSDLKSDIDEFVMTQERKHAEQPHAPSLVIEMARL